MLVPIIVFTFVNVKNAFAEREKQRAIEKMMKERILQIMRRENMTQQEFAKAIEVSPASLSNIFNGKTNPTNNHVSAIHRRFPDININWLMFGEGDMYTTVSDETKDGADGGESTIRSDVEKAPIDTKGEPMLFDNRKKLVDIRDLTCINKDGVKALDDVSFEIYGGEILGIAGIAGSGQKELLESIAGLQKAEDGSSILYNAIDDNAPIELIGKDVNQIKNLGISLAFVPEDRLGMGLVGNMGMIGNMMLRSYQEGKSFFTEQKKPAELANDIKERLNVMTPSVNTPVRKLSGGNVQKVLVGREISLKPRVLMTAYAVRGLDINTSYTIYNILSEEKEKGVGVVYVGEDLDVLLELCDRILVLCGGKVSGIVDARTTTKEEVGLLMTKYKGEGSQDER